MSLIFESIGVMQTGSKESSSLISKKKTVLSFPIVIKCLPHLENKHFFIEASCAFQAPNSLKDSLSNCKILIKPFPNPAAIILPWFALVEGAHDMHFPLPENYYEYNSY